MKKKSPILEAIHEKAKGLHEIGVFDKVTMRKYDQLCLTPVEPLETQQFTFSTLSRKNRSLESRHRKKT
jgi:DNA-binding transcriptional regulator YiaG